MPNVLDINPSVGHGVLFTQAGVGTSPGYDAADLRSIVTVSGAGQEGVVEDAWAVSQRAAGANMSVDADADAGHALVEGDSVAFQDHYIVRPHSTTGNLDITPADATNPRLDQIILEVLDDTHDGSTLNKARLRVVDGMPTSGATLNNRSGAAALPSNAIRLADVLVAVSDSSITDAEIRDRRPWARGANSLTVQTSGGAYTNAGNTTLTEIDATNIRKRIECSGKPMKMRLQARASANVAGTVWHIHPFLDGVQIDGSALAGHTRNLTFETGGHKPFDFEAEFTPAAGSHLLSWWWRALTAAGTLTLDRGTDYPVATSIEEVVRQSASND